MYGDESPNRKNTEQKSNAYTRTYKHWSTRTVLSIAILHRCVRWLRWCAWFVIGLSSLWYKWKLEGCFKARNNLLNGREWTTKINTFSKSYWRRKSSHKSCEKTEYIWFELFDTISRRHNCCKCCLSSSKFKPRLSKIFTHLVWICVNNPWELTITVALSAQQKYFISKVKKQQQMLTHEIFFHVHMTVKWTVVFSCVWVYQVWGRFLKTVLHSQYYTISLWIELTNRTRGKYSHTHTFKYSIQEWVDLFDRIKQQRKKYIKNLLDHETTFHQSGERGQRHKIWKDTTQEQYELSLSFENRKLNTKSSPTNMYIIWTVSEQLSDLI